MKSTLIFVFILRGFISLVSQSLLLREFLIAFYGNELTIGVILANWIFMAALGSKLAEKQVLKKHSAVFLYVLLQLLISLYLPAALFLIRTVRNILGLSLGEGVGILAVFTSSFFILGPLSFLNGMGFPLGCRIWSDFSHRSLESAGRVYVLEAVGFILAGPVFTYLLITYLNSFQIVLCLGIFNLSSILLLLRAAEFSIPRKTFHTLATFLLILSVSLFFLGVPHKLQQFSLRKQWNKQKVIAYRNSLYANLTLTQQPGQYTLFSNSIPVISVPFPDIIHIEELVHFSISACHSPPKEVLIVGGGLGGLINEVLKYHLERVDYIEIDPTLIEMVKSLPVKSTQEEINDPRVNIIPLDGRRFLNMTRNQYDLIVLNLPLPTSLQLNRFYTREFFGVVKSHLNKQGIFVFGLNGSLSYISEELRKLNATILNTLHCEFPYVRIIPGDTNFYLAANNYFEVEPGIIIRRLQERNVSTRLLNSAYIEYRLHHRWSNWFKESMGDISGVGRNSDLHPLGVFYSLSYWNALFSNRGHILFRSWDKLDAKFIFWSLGLLGLVLFLLQNIHTGLKKASIKFAIFTTGFTGMSFNLIIIFAYQSFYGFVFSHFALLVAAFMGGLSLGGWIITRRLREIKRDIFSFSKIDFSLFAFSLCLGPLLVVMNYSPRINLAFPFFLLSFMAGFLVGWEFPLANKIYIARNLPYTAGILYAWDLWGAWLACLLIPIVLVPILGVLMTCLLLASLKLISLISVISYKYGENLQC